MIESVLDFLKNKNNRLVNERNIEEKLYNPGKKVINAATLNMNSLLNHSESSAVILTEDSGFIKGKLTTVPLRENGYPILKTNEGMYEVINNPYVFIKNQ